jgi:P-type conjugative transfer protein TrbL
MDGGLLDATLAQFTAAIQGTWGPTLTIFMVRILQAVTFLQFLVIFTQAAMNRDMSRLFDDLVIGGVRIGIIWIVFANSALWGQAVIDTGTAIGQAITLGSPGTLTPSGVLNQGLGLAEILWNAKGAGTWLHPVQDIEFFVTALIVFLAWLIAALVLFEALLEAAVLVYGGSILIAFSPFHWTGELMVHWAKAMFAIAIKIAIVLGLLAIGMAIAQIWAAQLNAISSTMTTNIWALLQAAAMSIVFVYLLWKVPHMYTGLIGGSPAFQFGSAFAGAVMGSAAGTAIDAAGAAAKSGAKAATKGVSAGAHAGAHAAANIARQVNTWLLTP